MKEDKALNIAVGIGVIGGLIGGIVLAIIISALGVFDSYLHSSAALVNTPVPVAHPFREWLDDTGGWAGGILAFIAAGGTIILLIKQNKSLSEQNRTLAKQAVSHEIREMTEEHCVLMELRNAVNLINDFRPQMLIYLQTAEPAAQQYVFCERYNRSRAALAADHRSAEAQLLIDRFFDFDENGKLPALNHYYARFEFVFGRDAHKFFDSIKSDDVEITRGNFFKATRTTFAEFFFFDVQTVQGRSGFIVTGVSETQKMRDVESQIGAALDALDIKIAEVGATISELKAHLSSLP